MKQLLTSFLMVTAMASAQNPSIQYTLGMLKPQTHLLEVTILIRGLPGDEKEIDLSLPTWRTGRYVLFDFAGGVQGFSAVDDKNGSLAWEKTDKSTWRIHRRKAPSVTVRYLVYANETGERTRGLNDEHAFVDPASTFMYVKKYDKIPVTLKVEPFGNWHVTTGLDEVKGSKNTYSAPSYEHFADCPLEVGTQKDFVFEVEGKPHVLMVYGEGNWDEKKIIPDISKLVKANKEFWGVLPYDRYIFMLHVSPTMGGGTEHINSTIMQTRPFVFKDPGAYKGFLDLVSHEYFHTWNVKQLRPAGITPYQFQNENYLRELWIAEGTTSYYGPLLLLRTGFSTAQEYTNTIAASVQGDKAKPGNREQSLSESSFDAWVKYWRGRQQAFNAESDYYDKGSDVSMLLDLEIRHRSGNKNSLDDVMRAMYKRFPLGKGYTVDDFQTVSEEKAGSSLKKFFDSFVHGTVQLPWEESLGYAGLQLAPKDTTAKSWLGLAASDMGERTRVWRIAAGSPAEEAGMSINDEIIALNGFRVRAADLTNRIGEMKAGDKIKLTVFREERLREFDVTLRNQEIPSYRITKVKYPTELQRKIYENWLKTSWEEKPSTTPPQ